jgi:hypothetical protein
VKGKGKENFKPKKLKLKLHVEEKLYKSNLKLQGCRIEEIHPPECKKLQVHRISHIGSVVLYIVY